MQSLQHSAANAVQTDGIMTFCVAHVDSFGSCGFIWFMWIHLVHVDSFGSLGYSRFASL